VRDDFCDRRSFAHSADNRDIRPAMSPSRPAGARTTRYFAAISCIRRSRLVIPSCRQTSMSIQRSRPGPGGDLMERYCDTETLCCMAHFPSPSTGKIRPPGQRIFLRGGKLKARGARCRKDPHLTSPRKEQGYRIWFSSHGWLCSSQISTRSSIRACMGRFRSTGANWALTPHANEIQRADQFPQVNCIPIVELDGSAKKSDES